MLLWSDHGTNFVGVGSETAKTFIESQRHKAKSLPLAPSMAIHLRTCTTLWWAVGSRIEELQLTPTPEM